MRAAGVQENIFHLDRAAPEAAGVVRIGDTLAATALASAWNGLLLHRLTVATQRPSAFHIGAYAVLT
jgi:hypothetical protein